MEKNKDEEDVRIAEERLEKIKNGGGTVGMEEIEGKFKSGEKRKGLGTLITETLRSFELNEEELEEFQRSLEEARHPKSVKVVARTNMRISVRRNNIFRLYEIPFKRTFIMDKLNICGHIYNISDIITNHLVKKIYGPYTDTDKYREFVNESKRIFNNVIEKSYKNSINYYGISIYDVTDSFFELKDCEIEEFHIPLYLDDNISGLECLNK